MTASIQKIVLRLTGLTADRVRVEPRPPLDIQTNRLYDLWTPRGHWIAKQFAKPDEYEGAPRREFDALQLVAPLDIAPRPVHFEPHSAKSPPVVVYEYLEGEMWDRRPPSAADLRALCDLYLRVHSVTRPDLWPSHHTHRSLRDAFLEFTRLAALYRQWAEANHAPGVKAIGRVAASLPAIEAACAELDTLTPRMLFCRSDPRFANVVARPDGRLAMVDWEDCGLRDPAREIADLLLHPNQEDLLTPTEWQPFLTPYLNALTPGDPEIERRRRLYMALFPPFWLFGILASAVRRASTGADPNRPVNGMPFNTRARRYVARVLAWPDGDFDAALAEVADSSFFPDNQDTLEYDSRR